MLLITAIAISVLGQPRGELSWKDIPVPPVEENAVPIARIFEVSKDQAKPLTELIRLLFGDSVKTAVVGNHLVVVAGPGKLDFIAAIGQEVLGSRPPGGEAVPPPVRKVPLPPRPPRFPPVPEGAPESVEAPPEEASALRAAVVDSLAGLFYQSFPASQAAFYSPSGGIEIRQSIELNAASLEAIAQFIARVKERMKAVEVSELNASRRAGEWVVKIDFSVLGGKVDAAGLPPPRFLSFPETFGALQKALESAEAFDRLRALDLKLRLKKTRGQSGAVYRPEDSTMLLVFPGATDPFRIEKALNEKSGPFTATISVNAKPEGPRIAVTLRPSREAPNQPGTR